MFENQKDLQRINYVLDLPDGSNDVICDIAFNGFPKVINFA